MKFAATLLALAGSAAAFAPSSVSKSSTALNVYTSLEEMPGGLAPVGVWDPAGFCKVATPGDLGRLREAE